MRETSRFVVSLVDVETIESRRVGLGLIEMEVVADDCESFGRVRSGFCSLIEAKILLAAFSNGEYHPKEIF